MNTYVRLLFVLLLVSLCAISRVRADAKEVGAAAAGKKNDPKEVIEKGAVRKIETAQGNLKTQPTSSKSTGPEKIKATSSTGQLAQLRSRPLNTTRLGAQIPALTAAKNATTSLGRQKQNATRTKRPLDASTTPVAHQLERIASFRMRDSILRYGPRCKFVLVGDSIVFYLKRNATLWQSYVNRYAGINLGNPGDRTEHLLHRIQSKLFRNLTSPQLLAVMVGTNNVGAGDSASATLSGVVNVVTLLGKEFPKAKVLVFSILPRGGSVEMAKTITDVNTKLKDKYSAGAAATTEFLDLTASFSTANGSINTKLFERDQLHPNSKGSLILLQALDPYLSKIAPYPPPYEAPRVPNRAIPAKGRNATKIAASPALTSKKIVAKKTAPQPAPAPAPAPAPDPVPAPAPKSGGLFSSLFGWLGGGGGK